MIYDDDTKLHSHHDTDPARGQHSAFDLVRLHRFGALDAAVPAETAITDRPSYHAMVEWANSLPEIRAQRAGAELADIGPEDQRTTGGTAESLATPGGVAHAQSRAADSQAQPDQSARFTVTSADDFSAGTPLDWIVRHVLPRAELAVVFGESGSGKSFFALDLCAAITRGIEWRTRRTARGGVVYVCAEGARGFKARLRAYAHEHKVELAKLPAVVADAPNLLEPREAALLTHAIVTWIRAQGPIDVVVIDTLSATTPGGNENSGEDMGLVLSHCKLIHQQTGALIVLIHHSGKDSTKGARGWSGLRAAADAEIEIVRNGDYRVANVTKMKDGTDGESFAFKLKVVPLGLDADGETESSCVVEHVEQVAATPGTTKQRATGRHQLAMLDMLRTMAPSGTVNYEDLVRGYASKMPKGDGRDRRDRDAKRALEELITKKLAYMHGEDRVSLTSLVTSGGDWPG